MKLRIITRLGDVPLGATVSKLQGAEKYRVRRYFNKNPCFDSGTVYAEQGCILLVSAEDNGARYVGAFCLDVEVIWHTDLEELNKRWYKKVSP